MCCNRTNLHQICASVLLKKSFRPIAYFEIEMEIEDSKFESSVFVIIGISKYFNIIISIAALIRCVNCGIKIIRVLIVEIEKKVHSVFAAIYVGAHHSNVVKRRMLHFLMIIHK